MNTSNYINLIGRLGSDPKLVTLPSGNVVAELNLATNDYYRDRDGVKQTRTEWHTVKAYGKVGELFGQYLQRGEQVSIVGTMRYRKWVDKHEQNRISAEVITDSFSFIGNRAEGGGRTNNYEDNNSLVAEPGTTARRPTASSSIDLSAEPVLVDANADLPF